MTRFPPLRLFPSLELLYPWGTHLIYCQIETKNVPLSACGVKLLCFLQYLNLNPMAKWLLLLILLLPFTSCTVKTLATSCFCDVSSSCDAYCCCDSDCPTALKYNWNNFTLCASDGYAIPLCSYYYNQTMHTHDLYQGLRVIYTIVKRLFCISRVNFVDPAKGFTSSTTDSQINIPITTTSAFNSHISSLASISNYGNLPLRGGMGICGQYALRDMNNIQEGECRTLLSSTAALASNPFLSLALVKQNNNLNNSLQVYHMMTPSAPSQTTTTATTTCTGSTCLVVKQIVLFFIKTSSSVTVDYSSSYVVLGNTVITGSTYVYMKYSYQFISQSGNFPYSSTIGYSKNAPLVLLKSSTNGSTTNYYKVFNPVNLAFTNLDGTCRASSAIDSDHSNLITLKLGVNSIYTCLGSSLLAATHLKQAFDMVGSIGSASTSLSDYITIDYTPASSATNQNLQLVFYYVSIGTQASPQYQITKAVLNPLSVSSNGLFTLFVEYVAVNTSIILNLPSPPIIDAYLPDDFLYPFYVAE